MAVGLSFLQVAWSRLQGACIGNAYKCPGQSVPSMFQLEVCQTPLQYRAAGLSHKELRFVIQKRYTSCNLQWCLASLKQ